jgi:hypothetical protein
MSRIPAKPVKRRTARYDNLTIDPENNITAFASAAEAKSNPEAARFRSAKDLAKLAANWPATRLIKSGIAYPA